MSWGTVNNASQRHSAAIDMMVKFLQSVLCKTMSTFYARWASVFLVKVLEHVSGSGFILILLHCQRDHWCKLGWIQLFFLWKYGSDCHIVKPVYKNLVVNRIIICQTSPLTQIIPVCAPDWGSSNGVCINGEKKQRVVYISHVEISLLHASVVMRWMWFRCTFVSSVGASRGCESRRMERDTWKG